MLPTTPVIKGLEVLEIPIAENQPQYSTLPALVGRDAQGTVLSRWEFSDEEREQISKGASLYLEMWTFGGAVQPVKMYVDGEPDILYKNEIISRLKLS